MRYKPKSTAALQGALGGAGCNARRGGPGHRRVGKNGWPTSQGSGVALTTW
jgi:hypothetical protein